MEVSSCAFPGDPGQMRRSQRHSVGLTLAMERALMTLKSALTASFMWSICRCHDRVTLIFEVSIHVAWSLSRDAHRLVVHAANRALALVA